MGFSLLCLLFSVSLGAVFQHIVDCSNGKCPTSYTVDGLDNPDIECLEGDQHSFNVEAPGHPFAIRVASQGALQTAGVTGTNPTENGTITVDCDNVANNGNIVYQCTIHSAMTGKIYNPPGSPVAPSLTTFLDPHNKERTNWTIPPVVWDDTLVSAGQRVANTCNYNFLAPFAQRYALLLGIPFNQFAYNQTVGSNQGFTNLDQHIAVRKDWVCDTNNCTNPTPNWCNIYRSIVWKDTVRVGCATSNCGNLGTFWVCLYNPGLASGHPFGTNFQQYCHPGTTPTPTPGAPIPGGPVPTSTPGVTPTPPPGVTPTDVPTPTPGVMPTPSVTPTDIPTDTPTPTPGVTPTPGGPVPTPTPGVPTPGGPTPTPGVPSPNPAPGPAPVSPPSNSPVSPPSNSPVSPPSSAPVAPPSDGSSGSSGLRGWEIGLIVLGVILFFSIIFMLVMCKSF